MTSAVPPGKPSFNDLDANILKFLSALACQVLISRIIGMWAGTISFQTNRGFAREARCFRGFEIAENGSRDDSGTGVGHLSEWTSYLLEARSGTRADNTLLLANLSQEKYVAPNLTSISLRRRRTPGPDCCLFPAAG
jgi:hypothetical protein